MNKSKVICAEERMKKVWIRTNIKIVFTIPFIWVSQAITITIFIHIPKPTAFPTIRLPTYRTTIFQPTAAPQLSRKLSREMAAPSKSKLLNLKMISKRIISSRLKRRDPGSSSKFINNPPPRMKARKSFNNYIR